MNSPSNLPPSRRAVRCGAAVLVLGLAGAAVANEVGDVVVIDAPALDDLYIAGRSVSVRSNVDGDVTAAGRTVAIDGAVTGDVMVIGETVSLAGQLRDDVRAAGRTLTITGEIGDHAIAAGETVIVAGSGRVDSFAWLAGRLVQIDGTIAGDLEAAGETVVISGTIGGDLKVDAGQLVIGEGARIGGDLSWSSAQPPSIHPGAHVGGDRIERPSKQPPPNPVGDAIGGIVFGTLTLMVLTATLGWLMRPLMRGAAAAIRSRPGRALGVGLLALFAAPLLGILALVTVIGAPVGLALLLGYAMLLIFSVPAALLSAAELGLERHGGWALASAGRRVGALALVSLLFMIALKLPLLGFFVGASAVLAGLGALVLRLRGDRSASLASP